MANTTTKRYMIGAALPLAEVDVPYIDNGDGTHSEKVSIGGTVTSTGGTVTQGSTTSGQSGVLAQGAVTTSAPTYTNAQTNPLSLTTKGGLRAAIVDSAGNELDYTTPTETKDTLIAATDLTAAIVNISSATDTTIVIATASQTTRVYRVRLNVAAAQQITVKSASTTREVLNFTAAGFLVYDFSSRPWWTTAVNEALVFTSSTTGQVHGVVEYVKAA